MWENMNGSAPEVQEGRYFEEKVGEASTFRLRVDRVLVQEQTEFQRIAIFENADYGKVLVLDGVIQCTTRDESIYHEMLVHPALTTRSAADGPLNVAVVGGADGGCLRELLKHAHVGRVTLVDIDRRVIELCRQYLPELSEGAFDQPKVTVACGDGAAWVRTCAPVDLLIIDSSDDDGDAQNSSLFTPAFYASLPRALTRSGVVVKQSGCSLTQRGVAVRTLEQYARAGFANCGVYRQNVPTYVGGEMMFAWATNGEALSEADVLADRLRGLETTHYHAGVHIAAFALPRELQRKVDGLMCRWTACGGEGQGVGNGDVVATKCPPATYG